MSKRMLIDAAHAEETRVVVMNGNLVEEFDFESRAKKQLRGNIYLAKVTRVEPSLQAAFVEYGGNRHGFLSFNEIHPDYYQIPHADREALMREAESESEDDDPSPSSASDDQTEAVGGDDDDEMDEEVARRRRRMMRRYKIQEVIKRRQIMLIQVVKEERGNKGAALTTYLSLAGRYCVLMPNTDRGGGISRKITAATDRKRLRGIVADLDVPQGMGLIVRTAGAKRTKAEIKRDYEYLSRAWSNIRETTLHSIAPTLIYEEEDLVKRAIRDLFDKDIEGIWVEGEAGFREARTFMRMLMPSQAKKIQLYRGGAPLFVAQKVEKHLAQIYSPIVPLKSGGYLVINQTEALVAVDVNSGKATRERNIEATALRTNIEAAEEAARQLRLRDLAGLIVIDFIDMDEAKNNRAVEKILKDCLSTDRARIQMGRISSFGLMEISRQRRRSGILEGTTQICPHCGGAGRIRSVESSALTTLRAVEMEALDGGGEVVVRVPRDVSLYILNHKREYLTRLLQTHGLFVSVVIDETLSHAEHAIDRISNVPHTPEKSWETPTPLDDFDDDDFEDEDEDEDEAEEDESEPTALDDADETEGRVSDGREPDRTNGQRDDGARKRGRRRRRGRRGDEGRTGEESPHAEPAAPAAESVARSEQDVDGESDVDGFGRRRRRGRRGGRRPPEAPNNDVFTWSWPARLSGEDPYEWRGPIERATEALAASPPAIAPSPVLPEPIFAPPALIDLTPTTADMEDVWVELPPEGPKPAKTKRPRRRNIKGVETTVDDASLVAPEPDVAPRAPETPMEPPVVESAPLETLPPESVPPIEPEPVTVSETTPFVVKVDPTEIAAPPEKPKRGWWRRG